MEPYFHRVQYYETDKMGCVHHSNYIRWMEEARVDFLEQIGIGFPMMEARGIYSPVTHVECRYRRPTRFDEEIRISVHVAASTASAFGSPMRWSTPRASLSAPAPPSTASPTRRESPSP